MASLVRPWIVTYTLNGKRVPKKTPGAVAIRTQAAKWYGQGIPGLPKSKRIPLATNKSAAQRMLEDLVRKAERGRAGLPSDGERLLDPLVDDWAEAVGRESNAAHVREITNHVRTLFKRCRIYAVDDLRARGLVARIEKQIHALTTGDDPLSSRTAAGYGRHARQFTRWLWNRRELLDSDPLAGLKLPNQDPEAPRRNLTPVELAAMLDTTATSKRVYRGLAGRDREILYLTAAATGYRAGELATLKPENFDLGDEPRVVVDRADTKNAKLGNQPLPPAVARRLASYLELRPVREPVWPGTWSLRAYKMFKRDLAEAKIPVVTAEGHLVFHSLRHTYVSMVAEVAPVKVAQDLSRHEDASTTIGRYAHSGADARRAAVAAMPLPGADGSGPLAGRSREELEGLIAGLLGLVETLLARPLAQLPPKTCINSD